MPALSGALAGRSGEAWTTRADISVVFGDDAVGQAIKASRENRWDSGHGVGDELRMFRDAFTEQRFVLRVDVGWGLSTGSVPTCQPVIAEQGVARHEPHGCGCGGEGNGCLLFCAGRSAFGDVKSGGEHR